MEALGLGELLSHKNLKNGQDPISVYTLITEMKRELEAWKKECKNIEEKMKIQE